MRTPGCRFKIAWVGPCGFTAGDAFVDGLCQKHHGLKCRSCGKQATQECGMASSLVCGAPLCDDCQHADSGGHERKPPTPAWRTLGANPVMLDTTVKPRKVPPGCARVVSLMQAGHKMFWGLFSAWLQDPLDNRCSNVKLQVARALLARGLIKRDLAVRGDRTIQQCILTSQ